jgi:hypothetical protein
MAISNIKPLTPSLAWLNQLLSLYSSSEISIPGSFREQAQAIDDLLLNDTSGLANSLLDFSIKSATVDFNVETNNKSLGKILNSWLEEVNASLRGKIPVGIHGLAKKYYKERWKGSSFIALRTLWENKDGFILPTKLWFVNGKDLKIAEHGNGTTQKLGD